MDRALDACVSHDEQHLLGDVDLSAVARDHGVGGRAFDNTLWCGGDDAVVGEPAPAPGPDGRLPSRVLPPLRHRRRSRLRNLRRGARPAAVRHVVGAFVVEGTGAYEVTAVGAASFAARVTGGARSFGHPRSPLERAVNRVLYALVLLVIGLGAVLGYRCITGMWVSTQRWQPRRRGW